MSSDLRLMRNLVKTNEGHRNLANPLTIRPASTASKFSSLRKGHSLEGNLASTEGVVKLKLGVFVELLRL